MRNAGVGAVSGLFVAFLVAHCGAALPPPEPPTTIVETEAGVVDLCIGMCSNEARFCPRAFPDGSVVTDGGDDCLANCHVSNQNHRSRCTETIALTCMQAATTKVEFVNCGCVFACP